MPRHAWSNNVSLWYGAVTALLAVGIAWLGLWQLEYFPALFVPDSGLTTFKISYEWVLALLSIIAGYRLLHIKSLPSGINTQTLAAAAWITALAKICFTLYNSPYDEFNVIGHIYKAISYALVFHAVFIARLRQPYRQLEKVQHQLAQTEQRWKYALDGSGTGVWDLDIVHHHLFVSDQLIDMLGYRPDELGKDSREWWDLIHPDDLDSVKASLDAHLRGDIPEWHVEHRILLRNGHWRWVMTHGSVMERDQEGNPLRMLGTQINIQKRKEQEQLLLSNKARLRAIFDAAPLGMVLMNDEGTILGHNAMLPALIGSSEIMLEGSNLWQWVIADDAAAARADWQTFLDKVRDASQLTDFHKEYRLECSGNGQRWMEWIVTPLPSERLYLGLIEDIDARRHSAELLEENAQLYRSIFESNNVIKLLVDPHSGEIIDANTAAADYYGYSLEALKRRNMSTLRSTRATPLQERLAQIRQSTAVHHSESCHRLADGTLRDVEVFTGPVVLGGKNVLYSIVHDITDRKQAEQAEQALNLVNMRLQRQSESRQHLNQLGVLLHEAEEPDDIVALLKEHLPSCFDGAQGELLLTLEEFSYEPVSIAWGEDSWDMTPFRHVEALRVGAATLGQLTITASLNGAEECERFEQLASECAKMIALMLVNLRLRRQLTRQAYRDALTGLYNRRHLNVELPILLAKASAEMPLSLALLDLDHFKRLNDTYGHDIGDEVLKALAHILENSLRSSDIACRYGGEEFVVVMPGANAEIALNRLNHILKSLSAWHFDANGERIEHLTFSAGLIEAPRQGSHVSSLIEHADRALYAAKHAGRGRVVCVSEIPAL